MTILFFINNNIKMIFFPDKS